jgi:hypothetical protein
MSDATIKQALRVLAEQAVQRVAEHDSGWQYFSRATAGQDMRRDQVITELPSFVDARAAFGLSSIVRDYYGDGGAPDYEHAWERLALQFVYGFLGNISQPTFDLTVFEATWEAFWGELSAPEWHWRGLAQLQNFSSDADLLDLGNGIAIHRLDKQDLVNMGWTEWHWEQLVQERHQGLLGSYVLATEHRLPKEPDNFVGNDIVTYVKATRTLLALRLLKDGRVRMGQMWLHRLDSFDLGLLGYHTMGLPPTRFDFMPGSAYTLEAAEQPAVCDLYDAVTRYEATGDQAPVNVNLALRSFSDIYERRDQWRNDTQLVDAITAAEALLGTRAELAFTLAFRVAAMLGNDDDERVRIFESMKGYYDTRSRVVHGGSELYNKQGQLKDKPRSYLENQQDLRDYVRRLLVGFLRLAVSGSHPFDSAFFKDDLDSALLHSTRRFELRLAMGLES